MTRSKSNQQAAPKDLSTAVRLIYEAHFAQVQREEAERLAAAERRMSRSRAA